MTESRPAAPSRRLIRTTIEMEIPGEYSENDLAGHMFPKLGEISCDHVRIIASCEVPKDSPTAEELSDLLALFMLAQFPELHSDIHSNIMAVNMLTTNLGAALAFPLRNSTPGTQDGPEVVEKVLNRVREISHDVVERAGYRTILNELPTPNRERMN